MTQKKTYKANCEWCGKDIVIHELRGHHYCSEKCKDKDEGQRKKKKPKRSWWDIFEVLRIFDH